MSGALVDVPAGYRAGGWEVEARIASGSWASVYAARRVQPPRAPEDPPQDVCGALKFLPGGTLSPAQRADLQDAVSEEVRFHQQADHPRLIRTFETFVVDDPARPALHGAVVLAMERASTSLDDLLKTVTPPEPVPDAARLICEICEALVHMHALGWVHGDLKPSNVLLMEDGTVRLADFGLARELEGTHAYAPRLGSSDFLPPEWWTERIGPKGIATRTTTDIWALGVSVHQLLTGGMLPFPGASARARAAAAQAYAAGQAQLRLADELPAAWRPIVADCLARDHETRRAHSAATILARIHALTDGGPARSPSRVARLVRRALPRRARARVAAALLVAAAAGTAGAVAMTRDAPLLRTAPVTVYNAQRQCQHSTRLSCRLGLADDPHAAYAPANVSVRVRHGDRLVTDCYVPDGTAVGSENGQISTRWYRVRAPYGTAWLPAVRAWPGRELRVARCGS
ncbi:MAG TPA: serine/threonine-protein kinase [Solirubrobacteraceae bacterium]|jgi:serine/threonine-protein kinase